MNNMETRQKTISDMQAEFAEYQRMQANLFADLVKEVIAREKTIQDAARAVPAVPAEAVAG
jgi:hypothetical protein